MSPDAAGRYALLKIGNPVVVKEEVAKVDAALGVESFFRDMRYASRQMLNHRIFAVTVIATIALGIGATVGVFSVVRSVLLRPLPYKTPDRLVVAYGDMRRRNASDLPMSSPDFQDLRNGAKTMFEGFAGVFTYSDLLPQSDGREEQVHFATITTNLFRLLGGRIVLGRDFVEADGQPQAQSTETGKPANANGDLPTVAILSYGYWQRHYGGNSGVIGQRVSGGSDKGPVIVGVLAPGFELLFPPKTNIERQPEVWIAQRLRYDNADRKTMVFTVVGRLKAGVNFQNAQSEVERVATALRRDFPIEQSSDLHIELQPMHGYLVAGLRPSILALMGAAVFLLLIACANVANLFLVRMSLRERELAVRTALGGKRWNLIRQVLTEALLLAVVGTVLGVGLAWLGVHTLSAFAASTQPLLASIGIDPTVLAVAVLCGLLTAVLFGIGPALYASRPDAMTVLRTSGRNSLVGGGRTLRSSVIIAEIALSFSLLTGAGLMLRSFLALQRIDPGFVAHGLYTFEVLGPLQEKPEQRAALTREIENRLNSIPGVEAVTSASPFPLADQFFPIRWGTEDALSDPSRFRAADFQIVLPGYFETMRTPLLAGRTFTEADNTSPRSLVLIDEFLAAKAFPQGSAIGKRILIRARSPEPEWVEVIGVVAHQRDTSLIDPGREQVYVTDGFMGYGNTNRWAIRIARDPASYEGAVRDRITQLSKQLVLTEMQPMDALVEQAQATTRLSFVLIGIFACIAALLSAMGIYGVLATAVRQRTAEIGVRLALGAPRTRIFRLIVGHGLALGTAGIFIGSLIALALNHWLSSLLVGIKASDPLTFFGITVGLFLIVATASWLPARRAAFIDPMQALRSE
jgi:predicted permease